MSNRNDLITRFQQYIDRNGGIPKGYGGYGWYVGVTSRPRERLFDEHKVNERSGAWIYGTAGSSRIARDVEEHFLRKGCQGGPGGRSRDGISCVRLPHQLVHGGVALPRRGT